MIKIEASRKDYAIGQFDWWQPFTVHIRNKKRAASCYSCRVSALAEDWYFCWCFAWNSIEFKDLCLWHIIATKPLLDYETLNQVSIEELVTQCTMNLKSGRFSKTRTAAYNAMSVTEHSIEGEIAALEIAVSQIVSCQRVSIQNTDYRCVEMPS